MNNVNNAKFKEIPLKLYDPMWGSKLANTIIELEKLRVKKLGGPVPPEIFFQLKNIFQLFESLGSARIEGNNTTLSEFVEKIIDSFSRSISCIDMEKGNCLGVPQTSSCAGSVTACCDTIASLQRTQKGLWCFASILLHSKAT